MKIKKQAFSKPFNIVFEDKYPNLLIGPGIFDKKEDVIENNPKKWILKDIKNIEENRKKQTFAYKNYSKKDAIMPNKNIQEIQWLVKSKKETEIEVDLNTKKININDKIIGLNNKGNILENIKITENIKVIKPIDKITSDSQIKAKDAMIELYEKTKDVYKIEQLLSIGLLGLKKDRLFVPTRWSITSVDDILGKSLFENIKNYSIIDEYKLFYYKFYDNEFYVFFMPYFWGFEMIEIKDNLVIGQDNEINNLKKEYANSVMGAYYAARLIVLEKLKELNKSARIVIIRNIDKNYNSKGVWVIREALREALKNEIKTFNNIEEMISFILNEINFKEILQKSEILKQIKSQKRLCDF